MQRTAKKILLVGWDSADWKMINRLIDEGKMPTMKYLVENGTMGNMATLDPPFSPMLWTSIATGKRPDKHGILGFSEPDPNMHAIRPVSSSSRKVKAIWNILTQKEMKCHVVGWWPSHPAEPINGIMISNHYQREALDKNRQWTMAPGTVHPAELSDFFAHFRISPRELTVQHIQPFVPEYQKVDQEKDHRLESIAKITAECSSIHAAATTIMEMEEWDLMAVYYDSLDHYSHGFMNYNPPRMPNIPEDQFELYKGVVEAGYRYHDMMLKRLIEMAGEDATVMVISDHGFHPDHLRPSFISDEPAGPAEQHRDHGIFVVKGPGIRKDERIYGACLLDVTPTLLSLLGLPIGKDMDGVPLVQIYENAPETETIPSWEEVPGNAGMLPPEEQTDPIAAQEALKQLVELGYIDEPDENIETAIKKTVKELKYNLGRVHFGASHLIEAEKIFEELYTESPDQPRFALRLISCYMLLNKLDKAEKLIEEFYLHEKNFANEHDIKTIAQEKMPEKLEKEGTTKEQEQWAKNKRRKINRYQQAQTDVLLLQVYKGDLLLKQRKPKEALAIYTKIAKLSQSKQINIQVGNALMKLKRWKAAKENFLKALEYDENAVNALIGLCHSCTKLNEYESAIDYGLTAIGLAYHAPIAHYYLGEALLLYGQYEAAENAFRLAITMAPHLGQARNYLIYLYEVILKTPEKSVIHRSYFEERGLKAKSPDTEDFEDDENPIRVEEITEEKKNETIDTENKTKIQNESQTPLIVERHRTITDEPIIIVSGLPRSGTSMMMQMLDAAGLPIYTDEERTPDESNPKGYYEHKAVKSLMHNSSWVKETPGKVVKVISHLLFYLPGRYTYKIIFMDRELKEVVMSQHAMLVRNGKKGAKEDAYPMNIETQFAQNLKKVKAWEKTHMNVQIMRVNYSDVLASPEKIAKEIANFLGKDLDIKRMANAVDSSLYRTKNKD